MAIQVSGSGTAVQNSNSAWASSACSTNDLLISRVHFQRNRIIKPVRTSCDWKQNSSDCSLEENEDISNICTAILTAESLSMFYLNVPNPILSCLSGEGYSPNSPFYKPFKLTKLHLYKYSLWILHQQINSAAMQATERECYEAKPFSFPHPFEKGDMAFLLGTHCMSIQTLMKEQYMKVVLDT